jgi:glycosyltransferase involved in cell wall biosynthesis
MKLSVVIPAHNEQACIGGTIRALHAQFSAEQIEHEILVVNDNSIDLTWKILLSLQPEISTLNVVKVFLSTHTFALHSNAVEAPCISLPRRSPRGSWP